MLDPKRGCSGAVPEQVRFDAQTNPKGVRCSIQDANVNVYGRDPATGYARRPYDNTGVQYGLETLRNGQISGAQFVEMNREVGGFDLNAHHQPQRNAMTEAVANLTYRIGGVVGRGAIARTPIIDLATYFDAVPIAGFHDVIRPFMHRARLRAHQGSDRSQAIWRGLSGPGDAYPAMQKWISAVDRSGGHSARNVRSAQPVEASDRCIISALGSRIEADTSSARSASSSRSRWRSPSFRSACRSANSQEARGPGLCQSIFTARARSRASSPEGRSPTTSSSAR